MKRISLIGGLLLAVCGGPALAEPSSRVAWTPENLARVKSGDAAKGKAIAESCASCHSPGAPAAQSQFPHVQGQLPTYLYKQLRDYKDGTRSHAVMTGIAGGLSDRDMVDVAAFYGQQAPAAGDQSVASENAVDLVTKGDGKRILPPCQSCHGSDGRGQRLDVPALAGQNAAYTEQTLLDYKSGARKNDLYGRMRTLTQQLSDEEIRQLARYYAGLGR